MVVAQSYELYLGWCRQGFSRTSLDLQIGYGGLELVLARGLELVRVALRLCCGVQLAREVVRGLVPDMCVLGLRICYDSLPRVHGLVLRGLVLQV